MPAADTPTVAEGAPGISVVVPAYNRSETLPDTLESLLAQTYTDWAAIVVDDGSADDTAAVAQTYADRDPRFSVLRQDNAGVSAARNAGLRGARGDWLLFLDADDWILPTAMAEFLATLAAAPGAGGMFSGWSRILPDGSRQDEHPGWAPGDVFANTARGCGFSTNAVLLRRSLVDAVGGFDEGLVTCEDWDLYLRLARAGVRFARHDGHLAAYRVRRASASMDGTQMLRDALEVVRRAHGPDARVAAPAPAYAGGASRAGLQTAQLEAGTYSIALVLGAGGDWRRLLPQLEALRDPGFPPLSAAGSAFAGVPLGAMMTTAEWPAVDVAVVAETFALFDELERITGGRDLAARARHGLEELVASRAAATDFVFGGVQRLTIDLEAPLADVVADRGVTRTTIAGRYAGVELAPVELPVVAGRVPAALIADAVADAHAWPVLQAFLIGTGWDAFMQQLWDAPELTGEDFYVARGDGSGGARPLGDSFDVLDAPSDRTVAGGVVAESRIPGVRHPTPGHAAVRICLAGTPLVDVRLPAPGGVVSFGALRAATNRHTGFELCRIAVRDGLLGRPAADGVGLRKRLAERAAAPVDELLPGGGTAVGRCPYLVRGVGARRGHAPDPDGEIVAAAAGGLVERRARAAPSDAPTPHGDTAPGGGLVERRAPAGHRDAAGESRNVPSTVAAVPELAALGALAAADLFDAAVALATAPASTDDRGIRLDALFHEGRGPWGTAAAWPDLRAAAVLALLAAGPDDRVLDIAPGDAALTARVAATGATVTALEPTTIGLARATAALAGAPDVTLRGHDVFAADLPGDQDAVLALDVLEHAGDRAAIAALLDRLAAALAPTGRLIVGHRPDPEVERALRRARGLRVDAALTAPGYTLLRLTPGTRSRIHRRPAQDAALAPPPEVPRTFEQGPYLPILMYHRVAPAGAAATARYRLHPDRLEQQLRYLRANGFRSATFDEWLVSVETRTPLPGRTVILTFDDGFSDFHTHALPLLERYGFSATLYVVAELVGRANEWDSHFGELVPLLDWDRIRDAADRGIEIGGHTLDHACLTARDHAEVVRQAARCKRLIEAQLDRPVTSFAYPYGEHDAAIAHLIGACGYGYAVTTRSDVAQHRDPLLRLPRHEIHGEMTLAQFAATLLPYAV